MNLINALLGCTFRRVALAAKGAHKGRPYGWCRVLKEVR